MELRRAVGEVGLEFHMGKTTLLSNAQGRKQSHATSVNLEGDQIAILTPEKSTKYLGIALALDDYHDREIDHRIAAGWATFTTYKAKICDKRIPLEMATVLYNSGCWTMTRERADRLKVTRRRMLRKM